MQESKCKRVIKKQKQDRKTGNECVRLLCRRSGWMISEACLATKNPAIILPFQSRVALPENLQNRQNSVVSLAPRPATLLLHIIIKPLIYYKKVPSLFTRHLECR